MPALLALRARAALDMSTERWTSRMQPCDSPGAAITMSTVA